MLYTEMATSVCEVTWHSYLHIVNNPVKTL